MHKLLTAGRDASILVWTPAEDERTVTDADHGLNDSSDQDEWSDEAIDAALAALPNLLYS